MRHAKVAISIEEELLKKLDRLVGMDKFTSRSAAFQLAVKEKLARLDKTLLALECSKLDKDFERALADEGLSEEIHQWPEY